MWPWSFLLQSGWGRQKANSIWLGRESDKHKHEFVKRGTAKGRLYTGPRLTAEAKAAAEAAVEDEATETMQQEVSQWRHGGR